MKSGGFLESTGSISRNLVIGGNVVNSRVNTHKGFLHMVLVVETVVANWQNQIDKVESGKTR